MAQTTIGQLIINSPWEELVRLWHYVRETRLFNLADVRGPAEYVVAILSAKTFEDPGGWSKSRCRSLAIWSFMGSI